jgi:hypothetical protein
MTNPERRSTAALGPLQQAQTPYRTSGLKLAIIIGSARDLGCPAGNHAWLPFVQIQTLSNPSLRRVVMGICLQAESNLKHTLARKEGQTTALKLPSSHCFQVRAIDPGQACVTAPRVFAIGTYFGHIPSLGRTSYCCYAAGSRENLYRLPHIWLPFQMRIIVISWFVNCHHGVCTIAKKRKGIKSHSRTEVSLFCLSCYCYSSSRTLSKYVWHYCGSSLM